MDIANFKTLFKKEQIEERVKELANIIDKQYSDKPIVLICVLKGAVVFYAKLLEYIKSPNVELDFIQLKSYSGMETTGNVQVVKDINTNLKDKNVIVVEDIIDTGITANFIYDYLKSKNAEKVLMCSLLQKPNKLLVNLKIETLIGFEIGDKFIIGYGLDLDEKYRNINEILVLK